MSFSSQVKEELINHFSKSQACRKAELAALIMLDRQAVSRDEATGVYVYSEKRGKTVSVKKTYNLGTDIAGLNEPQVITRRTDTKRAFLRGAFIAAGTITDPEKEYHMEILASDEESSQLMLKTMAAFNIRASVTKRRGKFSVYLKDGDDISAMLNICEAHVSMMNFENVRIEKEIRSDVNRKFNCDTANINKTITASLKQVENIRLVLESYGEDELDPGIAAICRARLENPDATIAELGEMLTPPLGKSGVNHRLRKIAELADKIRRN